MCKTIGKNKHGVPRIIPSDKGWEFKNKKAKTWLKKHSFEWKSMP